MENTSMKPKNKRLFLGLLAAAVLTLPIFFLGGAQYASAHFYQGCVLAAGTDPKGNLLINTGSASSSYVWNALSGTGKLMKYPVLNCNTQTSYTVGGDPTFIAKAGSNLVVTEYNAHKIIVFSTSSNTVTKTITMPFSTWNPNDVATYPQNTNLAFATIPPYSNWVEIVPSTGGTTYRNVPATATLFGIAATASNPVSNNAVFITDTFNKRIWKYDRTTATYSFKSFGTNGVPHYIDLDRTNNDIWGTLYSTNKIYDLSQSFQNSIVYQSADPRNAGTSGADRIKMAGTDVMVTYYTSNHVGAIHVAVVPPDNGHDPDIYGTTPYDVVYDTVSMINGNPGWEATYIGSDGVVRGTHFPI